METYPSNTKVIINLHDFDKIKEQVKNSLLSLISKNGFLIHLGEKVINDMFNEDKLKEMAGLVIRYERMINEGGRALERIGFDDFINLLIVSEYSVDFIELLIQSFIGEDGQKIPFSVIQKTALSKMGEGHSVIFRNDDKLFFRLLLSDDCRYAQFIWSTTEDSQKLVLKGSGMLAFEELQKLSSIENIKKLYLKIGAFKRESKTETV